MTYSDKVKGISERLLVLDTLGELGNTFRIEANGAVSLSDDPITDDYVYYSEDLSAGSFGAQCDWPTGVSSYEAFEPSEVPGGWEFFASRIEHYVNDYAPFAVQLQAISDLADGELIGWAFMVKGLDK